MNIELLSHNNLTHLTIVSIAISISAIAILLLVYLSKDGHLFKKIRGNQIIKKIKKQLPALPIQKNIINTTEDIKTSKDILKQIKKLKKELNNNINTKSTCNNILLLNKSLEALYAISIKGECARNPQSYEDFYTKLTQARQNNNPMLLRQDNNEYNILHNIPTQTQITSDSYNQKLQEITTFNYQTQIENIQSLNTTTLFGLIDSAKKINNQNEQYYNLLLHAINDSQIIIDLSNNLDNLINYVRVCAYRNIYLGAEIIRIIRNSTDGGTLTTEKSLSNIRLKNIKNIENISHSININDIGDIIDSTFNTLEKEFKKSSFKKISNEHPEFFVLITAINLIGNIIENHTKRINLSRKQQHKIVEELNKIIPNIQKSESTLLRVIEIINAINHTNNGFIAIYAPLRDKIFNNKTVDYEDMQALILAINEYKKISSSNI